MSSDGRKPSVAPYCEIAVRSASSGTNVSRARDLGQHRRDGVGDRAPRADVGRERLALGERRGQPPVEQQVPDVFERPRLREVDGAVLAVVVEAFEAAHVADGRVGDDDTFEPLRHLVRLGLGGLDHRDAHEVAHRDDADEPLPVDHRNVAVAVLGELRERGAGLDVGVDRVGLAGHPLRDLGGRRIGAGRREADHVPFGEDADRAFVVVDHHHRTDLAVAHALRGDGDRLGGLRGDDRPGHDVGDGALARNRRSRSGAHRASIIGS